MKEFLSYVKPYKRDCVLAIFCIMAETVFELVIPLVMASIVDVGVANGDTRYIVMRGLQMCAFALMALVLGQGASVFAARCGQGLGAELRKAEFAKLQQFSFANTDHFSTASLVVLSRLITRSILNSSGAVTSRILSTALLTRGFCNIMADSIMTKSEPLHFSFHRSKSRMTAGCTSSSVFCSKSADEKIFLAIASRCITPSFIISRPSSERRASRKDSSVSYSFFAISSEQ